MTSVFFIIHSDRSGTFPFWSITHSDLHLLCIVDKAYIIKTFASLEKY